MHGVWDANRVSNAHRLDHGLRHAKSIGDTDAFADRELQPGADHLWNGYGVGNRDCVGGSNPQWLGDA